jgi:hypothetical protein
VCDAGSAASLETFGRGPGHGQETMPQRRGAWSGDHAPAQWRVAWPRLSLRGHVWHLTLHMATKTWPCHPAAGSAASLETFGRGPGHGQETMPQRSGGWHGHGFAWPCLASDASHGHEDVAMPPGPCPSAVETFGRGPGRGQETLPQPGRGQETLPQREETLPQRGSPHDERAVPLSTRRSRR